MPKTTTPRKRKAPWFATLVSVVFWTLSVLLGIANLRLYLPPPVPKDHTSPPVHAEAQLRWLRGELEDGAGEKMQALFPEGWYFTHLLYGLSWVELGLRDAEARDRALEEARWALAQIETDAGKAPFPPQLEPDHGMFYSAWRNHLLSGILLIQCGDRRDPEEWALFEERCSALADTLTRSPTPFPPSYLGQSWPCDTPPAIHSLVVREAMAGDGKYDRVIRDWIERAREQVDPDTGLLPHTAHPQTGTPTSPSRATSQVIILRFLADIDPEWAREQYEAFQEHYFTTLLGIPAIREFRHGKEGRGDVDSGPLIFGVSGSATVVGMGVAGIYGDHDWARAVSQAGEMLGMPFGREQRRYLGGILPVGDAFLVHASTARPWLASTGVEIEPLDPPPAWRWKLHGISLLAWLPVWGLYRWIRRRTNPS